MSGARRILMAAASAAKCDYVGAPAANTSDLTSYPFTGTSIGGSGLIVVVAFGSGAAAAARTVSSITLGGNAMNLHSNVSAVDPIVIASYRVASGTTADIVVNWSGGMKRCEIVVLRIQGNNSDTPIDIKNATSGAASVLSASLGMPPGAVCVYGACSGAATSFTTTGATEDYDAQLEANATATAGHVSGYFGATPLSIQCTAGASSDMSMAAVSWR